MSNLKILINNFYNIAASPELLKLRENKNLWFSEKMTELNSELNHFAFFDNENLRNINIVANNIGIPNVHEFYVEHQKIKNLIQFICNSFNKYFPNLNAWKNYDYLHNDGLLSSDNPSLNPTFILMHDLIHSVIEKDFINNLSSRINIDDDGNDIATLFDELNEDLASTLSNFQPINANQGLYAYIEQLFYKNKPNSTSLLIKIQAVNLIFHIAKAELRGKINKVSKRFTKSYLNKIQKIEPKVKQLVDGTLSKLKFSIIEQLKSGELDGKYLNFKSFNVKNIFDEYNKNIINSNIIEQADSSALRQWMICCLNEMKKVNNYFKNDFENEIYAEYNDEDDINS